MTRKDKKPNQYNSMNERMKYKYRQHLRRIGQRDEKTVLAALKHIRDFEIFIVFKGFEKFSDHVADKYIQGMFNSNFSLSYITTNIRALKDFLSWLERQRGYRSKIDYNHIDYLNVSRNQRIAAKAVEYPEAYSFEEIIYTIRKMLSATGKQMRDKAIISLQALCTLRVSELRTVKLKNLIEENGQYFIYVSPKSMSVKFAKTRQACFLPLPEDIVSNVIDWRDYLVSIGFQPSDPLFPKVDSNFKQINLLENSFIKEGIRSGTTIRNIFRVAFENAGYAYIKPHSFRRTVAKYAENQSPAFLNAVRQNLEHSSIDTTLSSYGQLSFAEQGNIISNTQFRESEVDHFFKSRK